MLDEAIAARLKEIIHEVAAETECEVIELEVMPEHVHLLCEVDPQFRIGTIKADLALADRTWTCAGCGASVDRDKNAAENVLAEGLNLVAAGQANTQQNTHGASVRLARREQLVLK